MLTIALVVSSTGFEAHEDPAATDTAAIATDDVRLNVPGFIRCGWRDEI
jgi:hypothetical protein